MIFEVNKNLYWYVHNFLLNANLDGKTATQLFNELAIPNNITVTNDECESILQLFDSTNLKQIQDVLRIDQKEFDLMKQNCF